MRVASNGNFVRMSSLKLNKSEQNQLILEATPNYILYVIFLINYLRARLLD